VTTTNEKTPAVAAADALQTYRAKESALVSDPKSQELGAFSLSLTIGAETMPGIADKTWFHRTKYSPTITTPSKATIKLRGSLYNDETNKNQNNPTGYVTIVSLDCHPLTRST
jgi:hypothetical protein